MDPAESSEAKFFVKNNQKLEKLLKEQEKCKAAARREEAYCKQNSAKFDEKWREVFSQTKNDELKLLIEESSKIFDHIMSIKDDQIDFLLQQLNFANEQYLQMNFYVTESMEDHISLFQKNLLELKKEYEASLSAKLAEIEREQNEIEERELEDTKMFEELLKEMEESRNAEAEELNDDFLAICDEDQKNSDGKCDRIKMQLGQEIDEIANEIIDVIDRHLKETTKRKAEVKTGLELNRKTRESIVEMQQQLSNAYKLLDEKKAKFAEIEMEYNEQIPNLEREKADALKRLETAKLEYEKQKKFYANRLKELVVSGNQELNDIKNFVKITAKKSSSSPTKLTHNQPQRYATDDNHDR